MMSGAVRIFRNWTSIETTTRVVSHLRLGPTSCSRRYYQNQTGSVFFEIGNGVGGSEAMLFAGDMLQIYSKYFTHKRWPYQLIEQEASELGGIRSAKFLVNGQDVFTGLSQEAGVHRVQRVPKTEKSGRMHTSTVTISVVPKHILDIKINERDLEWAYRRASGPGGQHVNKTESAVRLVHKPTGIVVESQESRFQMDNKKTAMKKLLTKIQDTELDKLVSNSSQLRKQQVGNADRNEKIRTYNFPQDRITDHRINKTYHNLKGLFGGDVTVLEKMISDFHEVS